MSHFVFVIPQSMQELLTEQDGQYWVRDVVTKKEIPNSLRNALQCLKDEGPEYILENFDVYYSVLHFSDSLDMSIIYSSYENLSRAVKELNKALQFILQDKESMTEEQRVKYLNMLQMLMYLFVQTVTFIEQKNETKKNEDVHIKFKGKKKHQDDTENFSLDRNQILVTLNYIHQQDIRVLWDPPSADEVYTNMISQICYKFLESPSFKVDKTAGVELWAVFGTFIKNYNHGLTFVVRLVQTIKACEHLVTFIPEGVQKLAEVQNCKSLVRDLVRELTEWQTDEKFSDSAGTRFCSRVLIEMAVLMPKLMIPEVLYLTQYLEYESHALRNSVLSVIAEVIINVLTKDKLSDEERESRDDFLQVLQEHIMDVSAQVRHKVFQHWARLQRENAIPIKLQNTIFEKAVRHLRDKAAAVRKNAANCVTTFLEHNIFGSTLQLSVLRKELQKNVEELVNLKNELEGKKNQELKVEWDKKQNELKTFISANIKEILQDQESQEAEGKKISKDEVPKLVRSKILEGKFSEAFSVFKNAVKSLAEYQPLMNMQKDKSDEELVEVYLTLMNITFMDNSGEQGSGDGKNGSDEIEEALKELALKGQNVDCLQDGVQFLEILDSAFPLMIDLLQSATVNDMHEAVNFFIAAYKFNIDNALTGVLEIIKMINVGEQDRREYILNALKTIFLTTDAKNMSEHTEIIVESLIGLIKSATTQSYKDMSLIISNWVEKGILDNNVINALWMYFTKKSTDCDDKSRAALCILTMSAYGRSSIIKRNIKLVASVAFSERGYNDILLATQACKMISVAGMEKLDIYLKDPPFKVKASDTIWKEMGDILLVNFDKEVKFVNGLITAVIDCIFRVCSIPVKVCNELIKSLINKVADRVVNNEVQAFLLIRLNLLLGTVAIKMLNFLDETVYKELKRRGNIRDEIKNKKNKKTSEPKKKKSKNTSKPNLTNTSSLTSIVEDNDETVLEGAQAEDYDAEFILQILESSTVTENTPLGDLAYVIINVCEHPEIYDDVEVQCSAVTALLRYMLVSNNFCEKYMQLIFTILERSKFKDVKIAILIHCSDLLEKTPNITEPFTPHLYKRLKDDSIKVRRNTLFILSSLILRDMLRAQGNISQMAQSILDDDQELQRMAKSFFTELVHKGNNLYNAIPDIFSHLLETVEEEKIRIIMSFLFGLINKNKQMENLVDRFCFKYKVAGSEDVARNVTFCLTLIEYNEKGLRKLIDHYPLYKHYVLCDEVYSLFKQIVNTCNKGAQKVQLKGLTTELEEKLQQSFEIADGAKGPEAKVSAKPTFKKPVSRPIRKKGGARKISDDDSDDDDAKNNSVNRSSVKSARKSSRTNRRRAVSSDSDSD